MPVRRDLSDEDSQQRWSQSRLRVGANTRRLRQEQGLTQTGLAQRAGLSRNQLIDLEQGRRGLLFERLEDLAAALGVPVGELFTTAET
ncbi:helix-turn-helix transcriptional regulator [uncultured Serinicoccus sp.]|uniref:helix-turn-helix domain-containing protein n=1 Tax=uncultured Serinicoccus sp. TaxID=735514 RepID=UPI0026176A3F|nr:helix-turn-helix transcriptional regulator [uncultured Serinicoccus sp.]